MLFVHKSINLKPRVPFISAGKHLRQMRTAHCKSRVLSFAGYIIVPWIIVTEERNDIFNKSTIEIYD